MIDMRLWSYDKIISGVMKYNNTNTNTNTNTNNNNNNNKRR